MAPPYSVDLRQKAVDAVDRGIPKRQICRTLNISRNTLDLWLKCREKTGSLEARWEVPRGPKPTIQDLEAFREFAEEYGHLTQKEMAELWPDPVSAKTISRALKKIGFTRKKKSYLYRERDEEAREEFKRELETYSREQVVYVDEAGINDTESYDWGWCHSSERFYADRQGHRTQRISTIAGWCDGEVLAPLTFEGYCNSVLVETWVEECLVPELKAGQVVILDNASFHKSGRIRELIEEAKCELLFLPAYSPDLNKIEKLWARLKRHLCKLIGEYEVLWDAVDEAFRKLLS